MPRDFINLFRVRLTLADGTEKRWGFSTPLTKHELGELFRSQQSLPVYTSRGGGLPPIKSTMYPQGSFVVEDPAEGGPLKPMPPEAAALANS
jgi:hypothetical protein